LELITLVDAQEGEQVEEALYPVERHQPHHEYEPPRECTELLPNGAIEGIDRIEVPTAQPEPWVFKAEQVGLHVHLLMVGLVHLDVQLEQDFFLYAWPYLIE
jgi:hypothetical protein